MQREGTYSRHHSVGKQVCSDSNRFFCWHPKKSLTEGCTTLSYTPTLPWCSLCWKQAQQHFPNISTSSALKISCLRKQHIIISRRFKYLQQNADFWDARWWWHRWRRAGTDGDVWAHRLLLNPATLWKRSNGGCWSCSLCLATLAAWLSQDTQQVHGQQGKQGPKHHLIALVIVKLLAWEGQAGREAPALPSTAREEISAF